MISKQITRNKYTIKKIIALKIKMKHLNKNRTNLMPQKMNVSIYNE